MRFIAPLLVCAGIALTVAGCDPVTDRRYNREGVGTELYSSDVATATEAQDKYVAYICDQAGLAAQNCAIDTFSTTTWTLFVQAGMNDIDQRCDAYLTWLDAQRRDREPVLRQLATMAAATQSIMAVSGAGTDSLTIIAEAFGLASATYSNWNSRLLLAVNQSTVQTVVYSRQWQFRDKIKTEAVPDRPRAIYLLRNYLRICMPTTIEADINTTTTLVQRGDPQGAKDNPVVKTAGSARIFDVSKPIPSGPKPPAPSSDRRGDVEKRMTDAAVRDFQQALCVVPVDGKIGPATRAAVKEYLSLKNQKPDTSEQFDRRMPGLLRDAADKIRSCRGQNLMNVYEAVTYGEPANRQDVIKSLQRTLARQLPDRAAALQLRETGQFGDDTNFNDPTRSAIAELRQRLHPNDPALKNLKDRKNRQMDAQFDSEIH